MKLLFHRFTGGNPRLMLAPTVWAFVENVCTMLPSVFAMMALWQLIAAVINGGGISLPGLWQCCLGMAGAFLLQGLVSVLSYRYSYYASQKAMAQMRLDIAEKMRNLPLGFYTGKESGELSNTFLADPDSLDQAMSFFIPQVISMGARSLLSFLMLVTVDWRLAVPMYIMLPLCLVVMRLAMKIRYRHAGQVRAAKAKATTLLNEYLLGMRNLKSYNQTGSGFGRLEKAYEQLASKSTKEEGLPGALTLLASHGLHLGIPLIIFVATSLLIRGSVDLFMVLAFLILATRLYSPLSTAILSIINLRACSVAANRINGLLSEPVQTGSQQAAPTGSICFEAVQFSYGGKEEAIKNVSFTAPQNGITALVGPSGSGKSTLLRLACRFWDIQSGRICIGGLPIANIAPQALYNQVAMVFQENYLFGDTIRNNLLFGQAGKTDDDMILACQKACCHDFIMKLPQGYDAVIGEGGATLSGGERQRIAIARAILKDAPILLLDEPTSSLDAENEALVQNALTELVTGRTVIMVAHRLKTIAAADNIVVLDGGRLVQQGTHQKLLGEGGGLYAHLWGLQQQAQNWNIVN
ncbi:MAG: ABC transporter ATP-binding protein [Oscillospiraceae bacterium]